MMGASIGALGICMFLDERGGVCNEIIQAETLGIKRVYKKKYL